MCHTGTLGPVSVAEKLLVKHSASAFAARQVLSDDWKSLRSPSGNCPPYTVTPSNSWTVVLTQPSSSLV